MHVELELRPGKRRLLPTSHAGVRLAWDREDGTFCGGSSLGFGLTHLQKSTVFSPVSGFQPSSREQKHMTREGGWGHMPQKLAIGHPRREVPLSANAHHEPQTWQRGTLFPWQVCVKQKGQKPVTDGTLYTHHRKHIF